MTYFLDLFSGIGGFALGAYWAGLRFDGHYFSEVDNYAIRVYQQRFPDAIGLGDIRKIRGQDLPKGDWITCGGFPCQDISVAGKGAGLAGERSGLWFEYARLIGEIRPRYAIMENVGALSFRGLDAVLGSLAEIGYDAEWCDIRASDVGAPHRRERIWIVAYPMRDGRNERRAEREGQEWIASFDGTSSNISDPNSGRREQCNQKERSVSEFDANGATFPDTASARRDGSQGEEQHIQRSSPQASRPGYGDNVADSESGKSRESPERKGREGFSGGGKEVDALADSSNSGNVRWDRELEPAQRQVRKHRGSAEDGSGEWWKIEPAVCELVDGLPAGLDGYEGRVCTKAHERVNQLKCLGNAIVPQIAELIFSQTEFDEWRVPQDLGL